MESILGHILRPLAPKIEPTSILLCSFVSFVFKVFLAVFRSGLLKEIVESRWRPMCVEMVKSDVFTRFMFLTRSVRKLIFL